MAPFDSRVRPFHHPSSLARIASLVVTTTTDMSNDLRNLKVGVLFENDYICVSNAQNHINLEIPLDTLHRALKSCSFNAETTIRLTKKNNFAYIALSSIIVVCTLLVISEGRENLETKMWLHSLFLFGF